MTLPISGTAASLAEALRLQLGERWARASAETIACQMAIQSGINHGQAKEAMLSEEVGDLRAAFRMLEMRSGGGGGFSSAKPSSAEKGHNDKLTHEAGAKGV